MEIVPFDGTGTAYRRRVALLKEAQPEEPWSLEGERAADEADAAAGRPTLAFFAAAAGEMVGFARAQADPDVPVPGRRRLWLVVARPARRHGVGTALLEAVGAAAASAGATEFHVSTSLAEPDGPAFAFARGFHEVEAEYEMHLDLDAFGPAPFAPFADGMVESLATLSGTHPDWFERYYRLHTSVEAGVPWALGYAAPDREAFRRARLDAEEALVEGTTIAVVEGEWVGLCEMWRSGDDTFTVYEELTGVLRGHRRRGVGTALVAAAAAWARSRGYHRMLTSTSIANEAMQGLARGLGFRVAGRWSHLLGPVLPGRVASGREVGT